MPKFLSKCTSPIGLWKSNESFTRCRPSVGINISLLMSLLSLTTTTLLTISLSIEAAPAVASTRDQANGLNCTNHLNLIDRCASLATYSFVTTFNPYPHSSAELKQSCPRIQDGLKCMKVHTKCLSSVSRRVLQSYSNSRSRHSKRYCGAPDSEDSKKFTQTFDCIQKHKSKEFAKSERDIISALQSISVVKLPWKDRFNHACCAASNFREKAIGDIGPQCMAHKATAEEMIDSMVGELLDQACPDAQRLREVCPKLTSLPAPAKPIVQRAGSLTRAALELIIVLSDTSKDAD